MAKCATCGKSLNATIPGLLARHAHCSVCWAPICFECDEGRDKDLPPVCKSCLADINKLECNTPAQQELSLEFNDTPDPGTILDHMDKMSGIIK